MATARLNVVADVRRFREEFAKIPGITDKQAAQAARRYEKRLDTAYKESVRKARKNAKLAAAAWKAVGVAVAAVAGAGLLEAARRTAMFAFEVSKLDGRMSELSQETGIAADTIQGLRLAYQGAGAEFDAGIDALRDFGEVMFDLRQGGGRAEDAFRELGIQVTNADGSFRSVNDVFVETVGKLQNVESEAERVAFSQQLMSDQGAELMRVLGGAELSRFIELSEQFGRESGPEAAAAAGEWRAAVSGISIGAEQIGRALADAFGVDGAAGLVAGATVEATRFGVAFAGAVEVAMDAQANLIHDFKVGVLGSLRESLKILVLMGSGQFTAALYEAGKAIANTAMAADDSRRSLSERFSEVIERANREAEALKEVLEIRMKLAAAEAGQTGGPTGSNRPPVAGAANDGFNRESGPLNAGGMSGLGEAADTFAAVERQLREQADPLEAIRNKYSELSDAIRQAAKDSGDYARAHEVMTGLVGARDTELAQKREELHQAEMARKQRESAYAVGLASQVLSGVSNILDQQARENEQFARDSFALRKGLAISEALINTYLSASAAYASTVGIFGAGTVMAPIAAGVATAFGLAQVATIAAQQPSFHSGGLVADEAFARVKRGEVVVDAPTVDRMGGPEGVNRAMRGGDTYLTAMFDLGDGEVIDAIASRVVERVEDALAPGTRGRLVRA